MELISWSLSAIDNIVSTRKAGSEEPVCPDGTFAAGYTMDAWRNWRVLCLSVLSVEDIEDVYIFGAMIAGHLLLGLSLALIYRRIGKMAANKDAQRLPIMIGEIGRAVGTQTVVMSDLNRKMDTALERLNALSEVVVRN